MNWKESAKARFAERRKPETLVSIKVPEWDTTIHYWPEMTLAERREIFLLAKQDGENTILDLEAMAVTIIVRARDSSGRRLFTNAEKRELMNEYDPEVIGRIVAEMNNGTLTIEDAEKN
jgi:hypothetical protein